MTWFNPFPIICPATIADIVAAKNSRNFMVGVISEV
jgi:hypothetical protein